MTVTDSTFSNNSGGAIVNVGTSIVANSTFSGNSGGAVTNGGRLTVANSTFYANAGNDAGGVIYNARGKNDVTVTLQNTIVANSPASGNCVGTITDGGHNLDSGASCKFRTATGSSSDIDPLLDPAGLGDHGGPTQTIALLAGSPAIGAGDESICLAPPVNNLDQRGFVRSGPGAANCSIGAYEYNSPPDCCQCPASCAVPINGSCGSCTAVFSATCESGHLCVFDTPTPSASPTLATPTVTPTLIPTLTSTPTHTPAANDCCQCSDFCGAPVVGSCGGCLVVFEASCGSGGVCIPRTPPQTPAPTRTPTPSTTMTQTPTHALSPTATTTQNCVGDCSADGQVTVDELLTLVNIALGNEAIGDCLVGDANGDGKITIDEILTAVSNALNGCGG